MTDFKENPPVGRLQKVSVIMPVRNEAGFIERSLGSVLKQDYPADLMEVIIADGMSSDGTREVVSRLIEDNGCFSIRILDNPKLIFPTGFNIGLKNAKGEVIVMLGGHTEIARDYIRQCVHYLNRQGVDCVGGPIETIAETEIGQAISFGMSSIFGVGGVAFRTQMNRLKEVDTAAFGAYRHSAIERCGIMNEEMVRNQDDEYNYRLRKKGGKILLAPDLHSRYYSRSSLRSLWQQYFQYGYWKVRVLQKHPRQMRLRHFVPPTFVGALLGSALLAPFFESIRILLTLIAGSYVAGNLLASGQIAWSKGWRHFPLLPIVFVILHLSYGSGFLVGLVHFANRWGKAADSR